MNITLNIKLDDETLAALTGIASAIAGAQSPVVVGSTAAVTAPAAKQESTKQESAEDKGPFLWGNHKTGEFGKASSKAAYDKLKAKNADIVRVTDEQYKGLQAKAEETKKAAAEAAEAAKADKKAETKGKAETKAKTEAAAPGKPELIETFREFLPKDLDAEERKTRQDFVRTMLQRFGAGKVSELAEAHWALAIELVTRKAAGEDVDPSKANFDQFDEAGEEEESDDDMI